MLEDAGDARVAGRYWRYGAGARDANDAGVKRTDTRMKLVGDRQILHNQPLNKAIPVPDSVLITLLMRRPAGRIFPIMEIEYGVKYY